MLGIYKTLLGPILLLQGRWVRRTALRLPEASGPREGTIKGSRGQSPLRLLFVGDSSVAGVGVALQTEAMAFQTATLVAHATGRSVQWQVIAKSGVNTREALALLKEADVQDTDVLVSGLGTNDVTSQRSRSEFLGSYRELIGYLKGRCGVKGVVISGLPPMHILPAAPQPLRWFLGKCAKRLDSALHELCRISESMRYVSLQWAANPREMARDGYHPGPSQYRHWATLVSAAVLSLEFVQGDGPA